MRLVKIPNLEYEDFAEIRRQILDHTDFSLVNTEYERDLKRGFFFFWDSDYIPEMLKPFKVMSPVSDEPYKWSDGLMKRLQESSLPKDMAKY